MPYIITTLHPWADANEPARRARTRTAVATLEEAQDIVTEDLQHFDFDAFPDHPLADGIPALPESGGTVGPLPDGTVIEVERVARFELGFSAGLIAADHPQLWNDSDLVDKFNRTGRFAGDPA
jgi:hypothetical protein